MAVIYLKHAKHGAKVAISREEVQADKANGWVEFDPSAPKVEPVVAKSLPQAVPDTDTVVNTLPARRSRGRPRAEPQGE